MSGNDQGCLTCLAHVADREGAVGLGHGFDQIAQRHAIGRQLARIRHHAQGHALAPGQEGEADIINLGHFGAQLTGQFGQSLIVPLPCRPRLRGQCQDDNRHIVDPPHGDLREWYPGRNAVLVRLDLFIDADRGIFRVGTDQKAGGDHHAVILRLGIDVLHAVHTAHDGLKRLGHQFYRIGCGQTGCLDHDVDHRHLDLRLFLARDRDGRDQADDDRGKQKQRRQRRLDRRPGKLARNAQFHGFSPPWPARSAYRPQLRPKAVRSCRFPRMVQSGPALAPRCRLWPEP